MKKVYLLALTLLLSFTAEVFAFDSLMFNKKEISLISSALRNRTPAELSGMDSDIISFAPGEVHTPDLYLSSILYLGPKNWTVWINEQAIKAGMKTHPFHVTSVTPKMVEILLSSGKTITLRPHQSWIAKDDKIVEGFSK